MKPSNKLIIVIIVIFKFKHILALPVWVYPIENYIADFACLDVWLVIEIDGEYHNTPEQKEKDKVRDANLQKIGFTILRFTNNAIINDLENVLNIITILLIRL